MLYHLKQLILVLMKVLFKQNGI